MTHSTTRARLMASSMITGLALVAASTASAQSAPPVSPIGQSGQPSSRVDELVVTGSRIPQPNLASAAPITTVSANTIKLTGYNRIEDIINQLPQVSAAQGSASSNGASGTATVNLRDVGPSRTLVLIDGARLIPGDPTEPYPDLNFIPTPLVERIEVDTAGASAIYGSDAVAGAVNFIMKKNFEGLQMGVNYGLYQDGSTNGVAQAANAAHGYSTPGTVWDGNTINLWAIFGVNSPDGKGNVEGYFNYLHVDAVTQGQRDYSSCSLAAHTNGTYTCGGSGYSATSNIYNYGTGTRVINHTTVAGSAGNGQLVPFQTSNEFNYAPYNYYQRPDERYSGGFFAHYDINPHVQAYGDFMFMSDSTTAQIAPTPWFRTLSVSCNNPLLSAQEVNTLCTQAGLTNPTDVNPNVEVARRSVETGPRTYILDHNDFRALGGFKGSIDGNWSYDVYGSYSQVSYSQTFTNTFSLSRLTNALDVVTDSNGNAVCAVGGNCVPYNIWSPGGVTTAAVNYLSATGIETGTTTEQVASGSVTGNLSPYGGKSPWAHDGIGVALGVEYHREALTLTPDDSFQTGDLAGQGGATVPEHGSIGVNEIFGEARIPIVQDMPFAKDLSLDTAYRYAAYTSAGGVSAYEVIGNWQIEDHIRIRGGFNQSVRAPNVIELFSPQNIVLDGSTDPCAGAIGSTTLTATQAQCAKAGVSAAQYGNVAANSASQYNGQVGGNPNLTPETSHNWGIGMVFTSKDLIPGSMTFSADYFHLAINNVIQSFGADNILNLCVTTGNPLYCDLIHRNANGNLFKGTGANQGYVVDTLQNQGSLTTAGVDFQLNYRIAFTDMKLPDYGALSLNFAGTYVSEYQVNSAGNVLNCVGVYGPICNGTSTPMTGPLPSFKSNTRLTWSTPLKGMEWSLNWRYIGPLDLESPQAGLPDNHIGAFSYFDLAGNWRVNDRYTLNVGVNNIFDVNPPLIGSGQLPVPPYGNGNTFAQTYDVLGRYIFFGVVANF